MPVPGLEDVEYIKIDTNFLEKDDYKNIQYVQAEVDWMWPSRDRLMRMASAMPPCSKSTSCAGVHLNMLARRSAVSA